MSNILHCVSLFLLLVSSQSSLYLSNGSWFFSILYIYYLSFSISFNGFTASPSKGVKNKRPRMQPCQTPFLVSKIFHVSWFVRNKIHKQKFIISQKKNKNKTMRYVRMLKNKIRNHNGFYYVPNMINVLNSICA